MVVPAPDGVKNQTVLAAAHRRVDRAFTIGGAQAVVRARVWHGDRARRRQDYRPTQRLRSCRPEAPRVRHRRHRHDRWPSGFSSPTTARTDWVAMDLSSRRPSMTKWRSRSSHAERHADRRCPGEHRQKLLPTMPRKDIITASLAGRGAMVKTRSLEEACEISNPSRRNISNFPSPIRRRCCRTCATLAPSSMSYGSSESLATTSPAPITCCPRPARRASRRRLGV